MTAAAAIQGLDPARFEPHRLGGTPPDWPEKNCYADLWMALLHLLGMEPLAMLGHTVAVDFEGDQWTFFKPVHAELRELYGIDVQELTVWRPMEAHLLEHLAAGRLVSAEVDAHWLPDTAGTDYRTGHTKTTIVALAIDAQRRSLTYVHNTGCFELTGEDYDQVLGIRERPSLPLFAELVHIERRVQRPPQELARKALRMLRGHYEWRPRTNPFARAGERLAADVAALRADLPLYHQWAFASVRQAGSAFELAAAHVEWLAQQGYAQLAGAAPHFRRISGIQKALILKGARAVHTGRPLEVAEPVSQLAQAWDEGMAALGRGLQDAG